MEPIFWGMTAGFISLLGFLPYILGILKKEVIPSRVTWTVWTLIDSILLFSYIGTSGGINASIWVPIMYVVGPCIIMILSFYYGEKGFTSLDVFSFTLSLVSIILWVITGIPLVALISNIVADALAAVPTIYKTYQRPRTESMIAWSMFLVGNTINLFVIPDINFQTFIFPFYLFLISLTIFLLTFRKYSGYVEDAN